MAGKALPWCCYTVVTPIPAGCSITRCRHGYTYVAFLTPLNMTRELFGMYRTAAAEAKQTVTENNCGYLQCCYVADNEAKAQEEGKDTNTSRRPGTGVVSPVR